MGAGFGAGGPLAYVRTLNLGSWRGELAAIVLLCPILLHAALWNGYPLLFFDTGAYILQGFGGVFIPERSPIYSFFLPLAGGRISLWVVALIQSLIAAFAIVEFARAVRPRTSLASILLIGLALSLFTGLAWVVGEMEPDFLSPIVVLAFYPLAFRIGRLGVLRSALLIAVGGFAVACHPSHLGLGAGLVLVLANLRLAADLLRKTVVLPRPNLFAPAAGFVCGLAMVMSANFALTGEVFISRCGPIFFGARLIGDGIVQHTLEEICPKRQLALCPYRKQLKGSADNYLWGPNTPFTKVGHFYGSNEEYSLLISESLKRYPLTILGYGLRDTVRQFLMVRTGDGIEPCRWVLQSGFAQFLPRQLQAYLDARQQNGLIRFAPINVVHVPLAYGTLIWLVAALWVAVRRRRWRRATLHAYILIALLGNAMVCGFFSGPHDRYQSRIVWIVPLALLLTEGRGLTRILRHGRESVVTARRPNG